MAHLGDAVATEGYDSKVIMVLGTWFLLRRHLRPARTVGSAEPAGSNGRGEGETQICMTSRAANKIKKTMWRT